MCIVVKFYQISRAINYNQLATIKCMHIVAKFIRIESGGLHVKVVANDLVPYLIFFKKVNQILYHNLIRHGDDLRKLNEKFDEEKLYKKEVEKYKEKVKEYKNEAQQYKEEAIENRTQLKFCKDQVQHHKNVSEQREEDNKRHQDREQE